MNLHTEFQSLLERGGSTLDPLFAPIFSSEKRVAVLRQLFAIGELEPLFGHPSFSLDKLAELLDLLIPIDVFYKEIGGLVGYQQKILSLLRGEQEEKEDLVYHPPRFIDIGQLDEETKAAIEVGIQGLSLMGEIFPLGGAADRLHLVDEKTGLELPAAKLVFGGKTLLERLIRDVEAREHLYFLREGKKIVTPIAIMTSLEKENHFHVLQMLEEANWFGRLKENFQVFTQPLVPVVNEKGRWLFSEGLKPVLKPGGHGAIWKMAKDQGIFSWFKSKGRTKALVRQINNPIAGLDYGLLAFMGWGWKKGAKFGFSSCPRLIRSAEGVNVLLERQGKMVLTNIEYCDFTKYGIEDLPLKEGEPYSRFSSNTNLLFVDLRAVEEAVETSPLPGLLLNLKKGSFINPRGEPQESFMGRLESTMQNMADVFVERKNPSLTTKKTFITYNRREKTISTAKKAFVRGGSLHETPESCFFDLLVAARELLSETCHVTLPPARTILQYLEKGPEFVFLYHPCLGPLYSLIQKKVWSGTLALGAELQLDLSELLLSDFSLKGSLLVKGDVGLGRCILREVDIVNQGVDWEKSTPFWRGDFVRDESVEIILHGRSSFIAEKVSLQGSHRYEVEEETMMYLSEKGIAVFPLTEEVAW